VPPSASSSRIEIGACPGLERPSWWRGSSRPVASEAVANLADRIEIEARRSRFAAPGQDLELNREEQQELLDTLKATASSWQEEDRDALHELQLALAFQTSRPEQGDT
jgi:hypothetical protein